MRKKGVEVGKPIQIFYPEINYRKDATRLGIAKEYKLDRSAVSQALYRGNLVKKIGGYIIFKDTPKRVTDNEYRNLEIKGEEWKRYKDANYVISNMGRIENIKTNKMLIPYSNGGSLQVKVPIDGKLNVINLKRAVYELFVSKIPGDMCVTYINMNYRDCREKNLQLETKEKIFGLSNSIKKSVRVKDEEGNVYDSIGEAGAMNYMSHSTVSRSIKNHIEVFGKRFYYV